MTILKILGFPVAILYVALSALAVTLFPASRYIYQTRFSKWLISEPPSEVFLPLFGFLFYCAIGPLIGLKLFVTVVAVNYGLHLLLFAFSQWSAWYDRNVLK